MEKTPYRILNFDEVSWDDCITGIADNSTQVKQGYVFVAIKGEKADGHKYIDDAIRNGASTIIFSKGQINNFQPGIKYVQADDCRAALAYLAFKFYKNQPSHIVAVTGTNGKTSVVDFYRQLIMLLGKNSASIGTLGCIMNEEIVFSSALTTPPTLELFSRLNELQNMGVEYLAIEASSHGLTQHRLQNVGIKNVAFTSFSRDHLDYHHSLEHYLNAKLEIFSSLQPGSSCVVNRDMSEFDLIRDRVVNYNLKILDYGKLANYCRLIKLESDIKGQNFSIAIEGKIYNIKTGLIGEFQVYNLLAAALLVIASGFTISQVIQVIHSVNAVSGRMEKVRGFDIFVDYAHTPDALEKALSVLKPLTKGRLIVVFGCGGDRDKGKRPEMGKIAHDIADLVVVSDDNPRSEDPSLIRAEILRGCREGKEIAGREKAIGYAVEQMQPGDVLLIAGKGHEKTQIIGSQILPFDDLLVAQNAGEKYFK